MIETIRKLFAYDGWAVARIIASLKSLSGENQKALRALAHLLIAEQVWLLRLRGQDTFGMNLSPELSLAECEQLAHENQKAYAEMLGSLDEDGLASRVTYRNSSGAEFRTPVGDILTHVALHGTYHRGQIASAVRGAGITPANTDFISFVREIGAQ